MIRMIASDIDGTLLDGCGRLSERTKKALDDAAVRKIHTVIATGRAFSALPETLKSLEALEYVITSNGSSIFRLSDGRRIAGWDMPETLVMSAKTIFRKYPYPIEVFIHGRAYAQADYCRCPQKFGVPKSSVSYVQTTRIPTEDIDGLIERSRDQIEGMDMIVDDMKMKSEIRGQLEQLDNIYVTTSADHYIEIAAGGCSKAAALRILAQMLGIDLADAAAFGDGENDLEMIEACGIGVAVGNACERLLAAADIIAPDHSEDGVACILEQLCQTI